MDEVAVPSGYTLKEDESVSGVSQILFTMAR